MKRAKVRLWTVITSLSVNKGNKHMNTIIHRSCSLLTNISLNKIIQGFIEIGGIEKLWEEYPKSFGRNWRAIENVTVNGTISESHGNSSSCNYGLTPYWANMFRPFDDPEFPWFGVWFALPIVEIWYWCTDQV